MTNRLKSEINIILNHNFHLKENNEKIILTTYENIVEEEERFRECEENNIPFEEFKNKSVKFEIKNNEELIKLLKEKIGWNSRYESAKLGVNGLSLTEEERQQEKELNYKLYKILETNYFNCDINKSFYTYYIKNQMEINEFIKNKFKDKAYSVRIFNFDDKNNLYYLLRLWDFETANDYDNNSYNIAHISTFDNECSLGWDLYTTFDPKNKIDIVTLDELFNFENLVNEYKMDYDNKKLLEKENLKKIKNEINIINNNINDEINFGY